MKRLRWFAAAAASMVLPVQAGSLTLAGLLDGDDGTSIDLSGRFAVTEAWSLGAGVGRSASGQDGQGFSGSDLSASTDIAVGAFYAHASANRWKDSGQLRSTALHGTLGWVSASGLSLAALAADRAIRVTYAITVLGRERERQLDIDATGLGGEVSYFGEEPWTASLRFLDYDYGSGVARVRAVLDSADIRRFPRLQRLVGSVATRAIGAPDRELALTLGRQFARHSLTLEGQQQRDVLSGEETISLGLTLGWDASAQWHIDTTVGMTDDDVAGTVPWFGLALTLGRIR
ncbi:MAG: hypothetical protein R3E75_01160 [Steroidobacteraceae bacterium]|nr:hypothetical protein [Nevskiaceae bacterium]MCP5471251.1 hypothetical protein [Nevskiaceae bacterium]